MTIAQNLARARSDSRLGQDDVANALGISRAMVSYWEAGTRVPNDRQLAALSRLLLTPIAVLIGSEESTPAPDIAAMLMRGADQVLPDDVFPGLREFVEFLGSYAELADAARFAIRGMRQSPFVSGAGFDSADDARRKAEEVRAYLRVGLGPIGDIDALCELLGVTVYRAPLGLELTRAVSGAFYNHPAVGFSILVNLDMTPGRRRFTVAHELAHALFHSESERYIVSTSGKPPRERFADAFAGEFLMPTEGVRRVMEEEGFGVRIEDPAEVIHLQRFFGVSYITALVRLRQAKFLTQTRFDEFKDIRPVLLARSLGFEIADEEYGPRRDLWRLERFPPRFRRLLRHAVQRAVLSVPSAAALTRLSIDEITELVAADVSGSGPTEEERAELDQYAASGILGIA
ncbi:MAG: ImmA/IrrE family metallo-endopeptidase [Actinomycetota bacterium]|nr:ImmA/IrrE family metallo-endopeptidase [Actinomycetota bacterium]